MNKNGINFDIGLPLTKQKDFDLLYVDWLPEQTTRFETWLKDILAIPIAVTGQIGCGKTSFIQKALLKTHALPDITINLDKIIVLSKGNFWGMFLLEILKLAKQHDIDTEEYGFNIFYDTEIKNVSDFVESLNPNINLEKLKRLEIIFTKIENNIHHLKTVLSDLCKKIEIKLERKLFIYAEGVDKYNTREYTYKLNKELLNFLSNYKTLYETNLVHVFCNEEWRQNTEQLVLTTASDKVIKEMLKKRLGMYAVDFKTEIPKIYKLSGGNFRQALRLLIAYEFAVRKIDKTKTKALKYAEKTVRQDLLSIHSSDIELLKVVQKDGYINDSTIINERGGNLALFSNQIFIISEKDNQSKWNTIVNPLLHDTIKNYRASATEDLELYNYEKIAKFELKKIFNSLASFFLNKEKNEINVISYNNLEIASITNNYLVGRAGAYDEVLYIDIYINNNNIQELIIKEKENYDGISCFFTEDLTDENIKLLEINRNRLIEKNMIWWINEKYVSKYIKQWSHLRQFMRFFDMETDIVNKIEVEYIEQDIDDLELLDYKEDQKHNIKIRLEKVLNYVKDRKNG